MKSSSSLRLASSSWAASTAGCLGPASFILEGRSTRLGEGAGELLVMVMLLIILSWFGLGSLSDLSDGRQTNDRDKRTNNIFMRSPPSRLERLGWVIRSHQYPTWIIFVWRVLNVKLFIGNDTVGSARVLIVDGWSTMPSNSTRTFDQENFLYSFLLGD